MRFDRLLRLDPEGTRLTVEQHMTNVSDAPVAWAIWDVVQVPSDGTVVVPMGADAGARFDPGPAALVNWRHVEGAYLISSPTGAQKLFATGGPGWLAYRAGDRLLLKSFSLPSAAPPEPETPREVWVGTVGFIELEFVGPEVTLAPGESTALAQEWRFFPLGEDAATDEGLVAAAREAAASGGLAE